MKQLQLTREQQQQFVKRLNDELARMTMSWDNELRMWHQTAIDALRFASAVSLQIPQDRFIDLFKEEKQGLNMNTVMVLCNNIESRTSTEMEVTARDWAEFLLVNQRIADRWNILKAPVERKIYREFEIMNGKPKLVIAEA